MPVQLPLTSGSLQEQTEVKSYGGHETFEFERWTEGITNTNSANFSSVGWNKAVQQQENPMELGAGTKLDSRLRSSCTAKAGFHGPLSLPECGPPPRTLLGSSCVQVLHFPGMEIPARADELRNPRGSAGRPSPSSLWQEKKGLGDS